MTIFFNTNNYSKKIQRKPFHSLPLLLFHLWYSITEGTWKELSGIPHWESHQNSGNKSKVARFWYLTCLWTTHKVVFSLCFSLISFSISILRDYPKWVKYPHCLLDCREIVIFSSCWLWTVILLFMWSSWRVQGHIIQGPESTPDLALISLMNLTSILYICPSSCPVVL